MSPGNIKRGFNRLFLVAAIGWAIYCTVIYPFSEQRKAWNHYEEDQHGCYERELDQSHDRLDSCLKLAEAEWRTALDSWSFKNFYFGAWPLILAAIIGFPVVVYGGVRGIAAISIWVWRGYRSN